MMGSPALFPFHSQAQSNNIYLPLKSSLAEGEKESKTRCCTKSKSMLAPSPPPPFPLLYTWYMEITPNAHSSVLHLWLWVTISISFKHPKCKKTFLQVRTLSILKSLWVVNTGSEHSAVNQDSKWSLWISKCMYKVALFTQFLPFSPQHQLSIYILYIHTTRLFMAIY